MVGSGWLKANCLLRFPWVLALLGNVTLSSTVVASLVITRLLAVISNVSELSTVEATTKLPLLTVNLLSIITLSTWILTVSCKMPGLLRIQVQYIL